jgi:hypothetical protein
MQTELAVTDFLWELKPLSQLPALYDSSSVTYPDNTCLIHSPPAILVSVTSPMRVHIQLPHILLRNAVNVLHSAQSCSRTGFWSCGCALSYSSRFCPHRVGPVITAELSAVCMALQAAGAFHQGTFYCVELTFAQFYPYISRSFPLEP